MTNLPFIPGSIEQPLRAYLTNLANAITREFNRRPTPESPVSSVLLASPDGSVYSVAVTDAGVLTATKVYDAP